METEVFYPDRKVLFEQYEKRQTCYEDILYRLSQRIRLELKPLFVQPTIKTRVKGFESFYKKLLRKLKEFDIQEAPVFDPFRYAIMDMLGVRIVCPFLENVQLVEKVIRDSFPVVEEERKGADHSFKEFGYESIHFLIRIPEDLLCMYCVDENLVCEIQIRTILQDAWAEVEHELVYKAEFTPFDEPLRRKLAALNANLTLSDIIFQEIRDYQRKLHGELLKRRNSFVGMIEAEDKALPVSNLSNPPKKGNEEDDFYKIYADESIDELLLKALYAHNSTRYKDAIYIYSHILDLDVSPEIQAIIYIHRGMAYFAESQYTSALDDFTKAILLEPENSKAYYYRGVIFRMLKDYPASLKDLNKSLDLNPFSFDPLYSRAQVFFYLEDYPRSHEDCSRALNLEPDSEKAQMFLTIIKDRMNF